MKYEFHKANDTVFHIDSEGQKFYIIIRGKVGIKVRINNELVQVKTLDAGSSFGELALLNN